MIPKVVYNPEIRSGQLYYIEGDLMLAFDYDFYQPSVFINIPQHYDDHPDTKSAEQLRLHFIGSEVAGKQTLPCTYRITNTSIIISRKGFFSRIQRWQMSIAAGIILLGITAYFVATGFDYSYMAAHPSPPRKHPTLADRYITGFAGIVCFAFGYFPWRAWRKAQRRLKHFTAHEEQ